MSQSKYTTIQVRVTQDYSERLGKLADKAKLPKSELVREAIGLILLLRETDERDPLRFLEGLLELVDDQRARLKALQDTLKGTA